ncbi:recombinase family protein [Rhodococcus spelaei]|uniref:Recombinase family protein n=1 Tax=Rhodococcus spelaei TaxID=2546320 RepID=A0A541BP76_9NOCA|nr:recombinase family protein [Rhodococcus spelaei]TQF74112.1 recombinase family protein [Rhodococcus spelaei]
MSAILGYIRVSTADQSLDLQMDALEAIGCLRIWEETASGSRRDRPELEKVLDALRPGDSLAVWRLDRLGRSLPHLIETVQRIEDAGAALRSVTDGIDTSTPNGRFTFHLFGALAQFERELVRERTMAGLEAARARGRVGGQPTKITPEKARAIKQMLEAGTPKAEIAKVLGFSRATLYRYINDHAAEHIRGKLVLDPIGSAGVEVL